MGTWRFTSGGYVFPAKVSQIKSGDLIGFVVVDENQAERGSVIAEVIGQGIDSMLNIGVFYVSVLASEDPAVMGWSVANLGAPNGIHLLAVSSESFNPEGPMASSFQWMLGGFGLVVL